MTDKNEDIAALQAKIDDYEKRMTDLLKKVEGLDSLNGKRGTELGEIRERAKKIDELEGLVKTLAEDRDAVKKELEELKTASAKGTEGKPKETSSPSPKPSDKELADKLESELTDAEKKEVEGFVMNMTPEDRKAFVSNDTFRVAVLRQAKPEGKTDPDSIWRVPVKKASGEDIDARVRDLFKKHKSGNLVVDEKTGGYGSPIKTKSEHAPPKFI